jgi:predicted methyltransferase
LKIAPSLFLALAVCAAPVVGAAPALAQTMEGVKPLPRTKIAPPDVRDDPALVSAIGGAWRPAADKARDGARHPMESLTFWGLRPGATVVELYPGAGYWVRIIAPYLKATHGRYIATVSDPASAPDAAAAERTRARVAEFEARWSDKAVFGDMNYAPLGAKTASLGPDNSADFVLTARNIHNLLWTEGEVDRVLGLAFKVLKPGGVLAIEEHRADPRPQQGDARDGYVAVATVVRAAEKAGFVYDGSSEVNANPKDTKDHPFGVWTLPPDRQSAPDGKPADPAFDRTKYDAIGESDRMTLRFKKPG